MAKTIITAALTGAVTPPGYDIPQTPEAIAEDAYACWKAGAAIVHIHTRAADGLGMMNFDAFKEIIYRIRSYKDCDVIINCTSSGASAEHPATYEERMKHHKLLDGIEMGSWDSGTMNWGDGIFENSATFLRELGKTYIERGIKPEIEIFDAGMLRALTAKYEKEGCMKPPFHFQFCLGVMGGMGATPKELQYLLGQMPAGKHTWSAFGVGKGHMPIMYAALANGGNIRVGLEDNVVYAIGKDGKKIMATNVMLVERAVRAIQDFGNDVATPAEAREILGIPQLDGDAIRAKLGIQ